MIRSAGRPTLVVVGTGMAGAKVVEQVLDRAPDRYTIRMFGEEPHGTYNRVQLSGVLGGSADPTRLWLNPLSWYEQRGVFVHPGVRAERIDRAARTVAGGRGRVVEPYDLLVLATGSRPLVPDLPGVNQHGVFVFRTLEDCQAIATRAAESTTAVVLGGGLLGLEAARGLVAHGLAVTVVEAAPHLMARQLDPTAGALLRRRLEDQGVQVLTGVRVARLTGGGQVDGVQLQGGEHLPADLVIVSCGTRPNVEPARDAGLAVEHGILVDDHLRTSDPAIHAVGECAQHRGRLYGLLEPAYDQARVLASVLAGDDPAAPYLGTRAVTTLKVAGVDLTVMGDSAAAGPEYEVVSHFDPSRAAFTRLVLKDRALVGAILLGTPDEAGRLRGLLKGGRPMPGPVADLLPGPGRGGVASAADLAALPEEHQVCNCHCIPKGRILEAARAGAATVEDLGRHTRAGTGCGGCQPLLQRLLDACAPKASPAKNKVELMKEQQNGLDVLPRLLDLAKADDWKGMTEDDKQRAKWHGLFFRKPTPGHFMLRLRMQAGRANARQFRTLADLCDEFGKGFCDLTTRQQIQLRWLTLAQAPEVWRRLEEVGLHSRQTGMDNVRGVCGCPVAGFTPHELLDAGPVIREFDALILGDREFTNLPRKFNVTVTGCLENCCHTETQDLALVPAFRELDGAQVNGFNVLVGGKQGSGGYRPAQPLDVFVPPADAARLGAEITRIFRDHGTRASRVRARLAFLVEDRGLPWLRDELERRWGRPLLHAGKDLRKAHHADHLGIHPQKSAPGAGEAPLHYVGFLVPAGRLTAAHLRAAADLADRYGTSDIHLTVGQNLVIPNVPTARIGALADEPLFAELPYNPSPILRGLVACTGNDYCGLALIDTKTYALQVARELERRTAGKAVKPLSIHWSGCSAGCGLHSVATIGLQGCRSRVGGQVVDAAHVSVRGRTGPAPRLATDVLYDVPCADLADSLEPLVLRLPRD